MPRDVFISYSHEDQVIADKVCEMLEAADIKCWIASRDEHPGEKWAEMIVRGMNESKIIVFIISAHSNSSAACERELSLAHEKRKFIIPVRVEDVALSDELQYHLAGRQRIDAFAPPVELQLTKLVEAARRFLKSALVTATGAAEKTASITSALTPIKESGPLTLPHLVTQEAPAETAADAQHAAPRPQTRDKEQPAPEVALELTQRGMDFQSQGDLENARVCFESALTISEQCYESDDSLIAARCSNLGTVLRAMGELDEARANFERALEIDETSYGYDSPAAAKHCNNLGMVCCAQGDFETAREHFRRALVIYQETFGERSPYTRAVRSNIRSLAAAFRDQHEGRPLVKM